MSKEYTEQFYKKSKESSLLYSNIRFLREHLGMSQYLFAYLLQTSQSTVALWESGKRSPEPQEYLLISNFFNVSLSDLFMAKDLSEKAFGIKLDELFRMYSTSLEEVSRLSGIKKSRLKKIAAESSSPTLNELYYISKALYFPVTGIYEAWKNDEFRCLMYNKKLTVNQDNALFVEKYSRTFIMERGQNEFWNTWRNISPDGNSEFSYYTVNTNYLRYLWKNFIYVFLEGSHWPNTSREARALLVKPRDEEKARRIKPDGIYNKLPSEFLLEKCLSPVPEVDNNFIKTNFPNIESFIENNHEDLMLLFNDYFFMSEINNIRRQLLGKETEVKSAAFRLILRKFDEVGLSENPVVQKIKESLSSEKDSYLNIYYSFYIIELQNYNS